ncbi:MAG TPA: hypothetical protein VFK50_04725 [Sphingomicrobium sp.]|nr:hypothetical protein [Sphingomicrobium sp.]
MTKLLLIASAMTLVTAGPVYAKPDHAKGHGKGQHGQVVNHNGQVGYGMGGCPPGLAKKNNGCRPPGQAKKLYNIGQRYPTSYGQNWNYNQIPYDIRQQYGFDPRQNYYYGDGYLYQVDPKTMLIQQVVSALLR